MRAAVLALVALAACKSSDCGAAKSSARDAGKAPVSAADAAPAATCATASDCKLSPYADERDCCGELCGERHAHEKNAYGAMMVARSGHCAADAPCPEADCARLEHDQFPGCQAGTCVVVEVPRPTPCQADADCVLVMHPRGLCCGDPCGLPAGDAVHEDDAAALDAWRAGNCDEKLCDRAKCAKPTFRTEARCVTHQCMAERIPL